MIDHQVIQFLAASMGIRLDAGETATFARQLEHVLKRTYDVRYPELKARKFIPVNNEIDPGAEFVTHRQWDMSGMAKIISNFADDLPMVTSLAKEYTSPIKSLGAAYDYSIQSMRRAALAGVELSEHDALAVRRVIEQLLDYIASLGNADAGLPGFLNHANIPLVAPDNAPWSSATPHEVIADMNKHANAIVTATKETMVPDTMLLDRASFGIVSTKPMSSTGDTSLTILKFFLQTNPYIKNVDQWGRLTTAGAALTTRNVCYKRDKEVLEQYIPQEFEQFPPQAKNLAFVVPCHARAGGTSVRYPLACAFMDGTGA